MQKRSSEVRGTLRKKGRVCDPSPGTDETSEKNRKPTWGTRQGYRGPKTLKKKGRRATQCPLVLQWGTRRNVSERVPKAKIPQNEESEKQVTHGEAKPGGP